MVQDMEPHLPWQVCEYVAQPWDGGNASYCNLDEDQMCHFINNWKWNTEYVLTSNFILEVLFLELPVCSILHVRDYSLIQSISIAMCSLPVSLLKLAIILLERRLKTLLKFPASLRLKASFLVRSWECRTPFQTDTCNNSRWRVTVGHCWPTPTIGHCVSK